MPATPNRNLAFFLILTIGFTYLISLVITTPKVVTAFVMQFIYLSERHPTQTLSLILNITAGLFYLYLLALVARGVISVVSSYLKTRVFVNSFSQNPTPIAFTAGLLQPKIYISPSLRKISTTTELQAIILHEQSHLANLDPLRDLLVKFVDLIIPPLPFKSLFFNYYHTIVEVACDQFACQHFHSARPIASALSKVMSAPSLAISPFSAQTERLKVLIGQTRLSPAPFASLYVGLMFLFISSFSFVYRTNLIAGCDHLLLCFELALQPAPVHPSSCH